MGDNMSKSILVNEYNKANCKDKEVKVITSSVDVSLLDVLSNNEIEVEVKNYRNCLCKESHNLSDYYVKCSKCNAQGIITMNGHNVVCNECRGEKYLRIHDCYLCSNTGKIISDDLIKIKLSDIYSTGDELEYDFEDYKLVLKLNIYDKDDYVIKDNDVYYLKGIKYSKEDNKNKISKEIKTLNGTKHVKSEFKLKKEVVKLTNMGLDNGDFYFIFENEIANEKKIIYTNVLVNKKGYLNIDDLINKDYVISKESVALNESNYVYIDENINEYEDEEYIVKFNRLNKNDFVIENNKIVYCLNLDKQDLDADKKSFEINNEKLSVNYKKNLKEIEYVSVSRILVNKNGKLDNLIIKIIPYFENEYKISIKKNKSVVYVDDYKYDDYRVVETYKKRDYLEDYIKINDEDRIIINNDIVYIKRV